MSDRRSKFRVKESNLFPKESNLIPQLGNEPRAISVEAKLNDYEVV